MVAGQVVHGFERIPIDHGAHHAVGHVRAFEVQLSLHLAELHADADVFPVLFDQVVHFLWYVRLKEVIDDQFEAFAVRAQAEAVPVALGHTGFVEQPVRLRGVELRVRLAPLLLVETGGGVDGSLPRRGQSEVYRVVHLVTIDRQRHRAAEADVLEQRPQRRLLVVQVESERKLAAEYSGDGIDRVAGRSFALLVQRVVGERRVVRLHVRLAGHDLEIDRLLAGKIVDDGVDVGELIAGRVHLVVVGIPLVQSVGSGELLHEPRQHHRLFEVAEGVDLHVGVERVHPGIVALLLGQLVGVLIVVDVVLRQVFARRERNPVTPRPVRKEDRQRSQRLIALVAHRAVIDLDDAVHYGGRRAAAPEADLVDPVDRFPPKQDVVRGERVAVGPLEPLPEGEQHALVVRRHLEIGCYVGHDLAVVGELQEERRTVLRSVAQVSPGTAVGVERGDRAAVAPHRLERDDHLRLDRQPFVDRRQLAGGDPGGQHRRLAVLAAAGDHDRFRPSFRFLRSARPDGGCERQRHGRRPGDRE